MPAGTLYTYPDNMRAAKVLIAARYSNAKIEVSQKFGETNKYFVKKFTGGKGLAFVCSNGNLLQDSNAIAYYAANDELKGKNAYDRAQILEWMTFAETEVWPAGSNMGPVYGWALDQVSETVKDDMKEVLNILNVHLQTQLYLVGEYISLADIVMACQLLDSNKLVLDPDYRKHFRFVNRWFEILIKQPHFTAVLGKGFLGGGTLGPAGSGESAKSKTKKGKKERQLEEEMNANKRPDPFDSLPQGTFNIEDFKRFYFKEDASKSIQYFWEKFDPESHSIWYTRYKFPEELTKVFMSCNLITGMYQRVDKMRKHVFASMCVFGEDNNSTISGIWVWRGQELPFLLCPDWQTDYTLYDWNKLDPTYSETKQLVEQYFSWSGTDKQGRKFNQGKIFN